MAGDSAAAKKAIFRTAVILTVLTATEFVIAFVMGDGTFKVALFLILTVFKAFYIVSEFMHLGHEIRRLIMTIMLPFLFIIWLIIGLTVDGTHWGANSPRPEGAETHTEKVDTEHQSSNIDEAYIEDLTVYA